jgi:hypothetical protein
MGARAAGINSDKALARPQDLERRGDVRRVGKRWSTESPPSEVPAAMDRGSADEQRSDRPGTRAGRLISRQRAIAG